MSVSKKTLSQRWKDFEPLIFFNQVMDLFLKFLIFFVVLVLGIGLLRTLAIIYSPMERRLVEHFEFGEENRQSRREEPKRSIRTLYLSIDHSKGDRR